MKNYPKVKVAAVQAAPVLLDLDATVDKVCRIVDEAASNGAKIIDNLKMPGEEELKALCREVALYHHERWDGRGYPEGLKGDAIPIGTQAIGLADVFDALMSERCYKSAYSSEEAIEMIFAGECGSFNPRLLESLKACVERMKKEYE